MTETTKKTDKKEDAIKFVEKKLGANFSHSFVNLFTSLLYDFYEEYKLDRYVYLNTEILNWCIIDIETDLARLQDYHDIEAPNSMKIYAYMASWVIRRKPFQLLDNKDSILSENPIRIYINEFFAFTLIVRAYLFHGKYVLKKSETINESLKAILYHLKYRQTTPKALILLLNGIELGKELYEN